MSDNPLIRLQDLGQSIWLDFIQRGMLTSGELKRYIDEDGLRGVTSNPSIFEKAIDGSHDYDEAIATLAKQGKTSTEIYETLTIEDIRGAADLFRPVYERTDKLDGYVSLEVNPHLARDTDTTIDEGRRLWKLLDRPNVLIKVPATRQGLPAIQQLIADGINVNVTLLFNVLRYREVIGAYIGGLESREAKGQPMDHIASVASFFLSRIDTMADTYLEKAIKTGGEREEQATPILGQIAIASAKSAYQTFKEFFTCDEFKKLAEKGARPQRLLWASTSTKNPKYSDVMYVDSLIGPQTVNTVPLETLNAYRDHGKPAVRLEEGVKELPKLFDRLAHARLNLEAITRILEDEGVEKFNEAFDTLMAALEKKRAAVN